MDKELLNYTVAEFKQLIPQIGAESAKKQLIGKLRAVKNSGLTKDEALILGKTYKQAYDMLFRGN